VKTTNPFEGQWRCKICGRTFSRLFSRCAYCPIDDAVEDDWRCLMHEQLKTEGKAPWAIEGRKAKRVDAQPPADEALGDKKEHRKWRNLKTTRPSRP
jgi:hypothetical protein